MAARTSQQNKSFHLWMRLLAEALNDAGYTINDKVVIKAEILFTEDNVKEHAVRPVMRALFPGKESTTQLSTTEIQDVYQTVSDAIYERTEVSVPWPTEEQL